MRGRAPQGGGASHEQIQQLPVLGFVRISNDGRLQAAYEPASLDLEPLARGREPGIQNAEVVCADRPVDARARTASRTVGGARTPNARAISPSLRPCADARVRSDPDAIAGSLSLTLGTQRTLARLSPGTQPCDLTNAATMALLALHDRPRRTLATTNALVAPTCALAGLREARRM
jgi:hypothetical protein